MRANVETERTRRDALFRAVTTGDKNTLQRLLQDPNIDAYETDRLGLTALMIAADKGHACCIKCFVNANKTANINKQDTHGITALMIASSKSHYDCVRYLMDIRLINVNLCDGHGKTALMIAAGSGHYDIVKTLLCVEGIDVNISDKWGGQTALMLAIFKGHGGCAKCLIDTGLTDVNLCDKQVKTALMTAAEEGHSEIVKTLLGVKGIAVNISDKYFRRTALMLAVVGGHTECAKSLIDTGLTDVNLCDKGGNTALMTAAEEGNYEIVEILTQVEGIAVNIRDEWGGQTALMLAIFKGHKECAKCLIDTGLTDVNLCDKRGNTALMTAAEKGHYEIVKTLLGVEGIDVNISNKHSGQTALMLALEEGHKECAECLIDTGLTDVNLCDENGNTALIIAAQEGHYDIVEILTQVEGIDVNIRDKLYKRTVLMLVSQAGEKDCVNRLICTGDTDVNLCDENGKSALMMAAQEGHDEVIEMLTGVEGIAVNISDKVLGRTALMLAVEGEHKECAKRLIDSGLTDVSLCDKNGNTALMIACEKGYNKIVEILIGVKGITVNISNKMYGKTALMVASKGGHKECVKYLIDSRLTDVNLCDEHGHTALMIAARTGHCEIVEILTRVEEIAVNISDKLYGRTALMLAAFEGNSQCVEYLLEREDVLVDFQDNDKSTALMLASDYVYADKMFCGSKADVGECHTQCVEALISRKAEVNIQDKKGQTALMRASSKGNIQCVDALLSSKAKVNIQDSKGQTALMLAILNRKLECVLSIIGNTDVNIWERDNQGKSAFALAVEIGDVRYLRCFVDITTTELGDGSEEVYLSDEPFTIVFSTQSPKTSIRYLPGVIWRKPYIYNRDQNKESVVNLVIRNGLSQCLTCFLLAYSDVPLTEKYPCSHSLLDNNTDVCEYDEDVQTAFLIASKHGNCECVEYLLQFQRIRFHLLVMLMQKDFFVFGTISIIYYKKLCSLVRNHADIDQFLYMLCNGDKIGMCVDYLLSAFICQMNSSGDSALSCTFDVRFPRQLQLNLLLKHVSNKKHLLVHMETFCQEHPNKILDWNTVHELVKAGFFLWKWFPEFHGNKYRISILTRELVARDFAPGLFEWQGKQSSPLYYAFMSRDHGLVRYLMANLYMTPSDLECFQGDTQERECLLQIESENIQQIYREHFRAPWSLERLCLLSLSIWLRKNKEQNHVDKVLDMLPEMFRSRLPFKNPMRMICPSQWERINLDFLNHRMSSSISDEDWFHGE